MPLPPLVLDDLDWRRLTDAARVRIPALSAGQWTLHAPVDPGVTLIELYAWLLDQRVYWMDHVPEALFRAAVAILGEHMQPTRAARTVLALSRAGAATDVAAGTPLEIARAVAGPVFTTTEGVQLLRVLGVGVAATPAGGGGVVDRTHDLQQGRQVRLFGVDGAAGEARIVLRLAAAPVGATRPFSLFLDVLAPPQVAPQWSPDAADVSPPAALTWWYSRAGGQAPARFAAADVDDGTRGLRRAGIVRLHVPADWAPEAVDADGIGRYTLLLRTAAATFTVPPAVRAIVPDAVLARHERIVRLRLRVTGWLPLPGQSIALDASVAPPVADRVRLHVRELDGAWHRWSVVDDFARCGPADRVFRLDRARRRIEFGDGLTGRIPRPDPGVAANASNVSIAVAVGGGPEGNVGSGLAWTGVASPGADVRATALVDALGGVDAETVDVARGRIAGLLDRVERAVTSADHETVAKATAGIAIARAHAAVGFHPGHPCLAVPGTLTVFVVPWAPRGADIDMDERVDAPWPDPGALAAVRAHLDRARMVGTEVWVCPPRYRKVRLAVRVLGDPGDAAAARERVTTALRRFLDPLEGGDDAQGWPFGDPVRPSVMMREAMTALREGEVDAVAIGLDGAAPEEDCKEVRIGPHDLVVLADVTVSFAADTRARTGGLR